MFVTKRVLLLTRQVKFAINAKRALEQKGSFVVTTFTNAQAAVDYLRENAQDAVLVDFRVTDMPGPDVIDHMRTIRPDIAVIAAPNHPAVYQFKEKHRIQAIIDVPYPTRRFVVLLEAVIRKMYDAQPDTKSAPPVSETDTSELPDPARAIEFWVSDHEDGSSILEYAKRPDVVFEKLAAEEPPMPDLDEGSTIAELREYLESPDTLPQVVNNPDADDPEPTATSTDDDEGLDEDTLPEAILETALDQSTPVRSFSLTEFTNRARERLQPGQSDILPLPSWIEESERYVREPEFLPENLLGFSQPLEYTATITTPSQEPPLPDSDDVSTEFIEPIRRSTPLPESSGDEEIPRTQDTPVPTADIEPELPPQDAPEAVSEEAIAPETAASEPQERTAPAEVPYAHHDEGDPRIARMALALTKMALELTAEAIVLTRGERVVAYAGMLPPDDMADLHEQVQIDWAEESQKARIRFFNVPGSGAEYMLYTCRTVDDLVLSMIFAGITSLRSIRQQGERLEAALAAVPLAPSAEEDEALDEPSAGAAEAVEAEEEAIERTAYSFVWLLRDPLEALPADVQRVLAVRLRQQLRDDRWRIQELDVQEDYVYLLAEAPADALPHDLITHAMDSSEMIVQDYDGRFGGAPLWHDSYLVLQPGRELHLEEIQRFINFARE